MKKRNVLTIIVGIALIFITLTNLPNMSQEDRRHLPLSTYTAIGKLLTCEDLITNPIRADIERVKCVPGTAALDTSSIINESLFSSSGGLNYTSIGESLTCGDVNATSSNGPAIMKLLGCQNVNKTSTTSP
jgi:hypothetical protein